MRVLLLSPIMSKMVGKTGSPFYSELNFGAVLLDIPVNNLEFGWKEITRNGSEAIALVYSKQWPKESRHGFLRTNITPVHTFRTFDFCGCEACSQYDHMACVTLRIYATLLPSHPWEKISINRCTWYDNQNYFCIVPVKKIILKAI
ncbi:hypothetical protein AVEN_184762-1 [Araneus ventricosus]|uniref:Uncharacterized protein n=1 Tax=Araneus ventricosus TaxID=182803 RepID=A0A4Y2KVH0_ARAVE|nr:hypothetical protein AVEN_184762-1 [Araneus ventricosus]